MATVGERRSLPSPEAMLGQPWSHWVDAAKLHGNDGAALEESSKEYGKNREAMRLCREVKHRSDRLEVTAVMPHPNGNLEFCIGL
ncbi:UNVERIFIED_CONTAM: Ataxin-7 [Gekko kuhli]